MPGAAAGRAPRPEADQERLEGAPDGGEGESRRFFSAQGFEDEKRVRHRRERDVMMPAGP